mmetsp:Transcript_22533/g.41105  ORF Transcript_22533/g.41105 Transcript_22533/m.41105 type:complete len:103 (-) Transcript_22533:72-380(-)
MNRQYSTESKQSEPVGTFAGLICGESTMDLHYDTPQENTSWTSRAGTTFQDGAFLNMVCSDTSFDLHLASEATGAVRKAAKPRAVVQPQDFECNQAELLLSA